MYEIKAVRRQTSVKRVGCNVLDIFDLILHGPCMRPAKLGDIEIHSDDVAVLTYPIAKNIRNATGATAKIKDPPAGAITYLREH